MKEDHKSERTNMDYVSRLDLVDLEATLEEELGQKFGDRFRVYREDYRKSLNYDTTDYLPDFPITVGLELVNRCNLTCVMCYTVNHSLPKATLNEAVIKKITAEAKREGLQAMQIGLGSEALLYKKIGDVFEAASGAEIMDIFLSSNGVLLTENICEKIIANGIARVYISLDAATPETYEKIRGKPELERIEKNIHTLVAVKARHKSRLPIIRVSFCVQKANYHERDKFVEKWKDIVDHIDFQIMTDFSHVDEIAANGEVENPQIFHSSALEKPYCPQPFNRLDVWSNGDVTPCCTFYAKNLVLGNVEDQSLKDIWRGEKIEALRNEFRSGKINANCEMCLAARDLETFGQ